jgi:ubiquinone biosynthesis protein Coq4
MAIKFLQQNSKQTLREALDEYYQINPELYNPNQMDQLSSKKFIAHDVAHVLFGCDTTIEGECKVGAWSIFGTDIGLWGYTLGFQQAQEIRNATLSTVFELGIFKSAFIFIKSVPLRIRVLIRTFKMKHRWPFYNFDQYWDKPLNTLRTEFGITLI